MSLKDSFLDDLGKQFENPPLLPINRISPGEPTQQKCFHAVAVAMSLLRPLRLRRKTCFTVSISTLSGKCSESLK